MATATTTTKKREVVKFAPNVPVEVALKFAMPGKVISTQNGERVMYTLADDRVMFLDLLVAKQIEELGPNVREKFFVCRPPDRQKNPKWLVWLSPDAEAARVKAARGNSEVVEVARPILETETPLEQQLRLSIDLVNQGKWGEIGDGTFVVPNGASVAAPAPVAADVHENGHQASTNNGNGSTTERSTTKNGAVNGEVVRQPEVQIRPAWADSLLAQTVALVDVYAAALTDASAKHGNHVKPEDVRSLLVTVFIQRSKAVSYAA